MSASVPPTQALVFSPQVSRMNLFTSQVWTLARSPPALWHLGYKHQQLLSCYAKTPLPRVMPPIDGVVVAKGVAGILYFVTVSISLLLCHVNLEHFPVHGNSCCSRCYRCGCCCCCSCGCWEVNNVGLSHPSKLKPRVTGVGDWKYYSQCIAH